MVSNPIPQAMLEAKRWVMWAHRNGRKPPVNRDGYPLEKWNDPESWLTFETAMAWAFDISREEDLGVGFVLGDGFGGLDLDSCRDPKTGDLNPEAKQLLAAFPGAYVEVSPSGEGVKLFGKSDVPGFLEVNFKSKAVEVKNSGYFCVTGKPYNGAGTALPALNYAGLSAVLGAPSQPATPVAKALRSPRWSVPGARSRPCTGRARRLRRLGYSEAIHV